MYTIGLAVASWVVRVHGVVPRRHKETEDKGWLFIVTASAVLLGQSLSCLLESPCIAKCFTERQVLFGEFFT